MDLILTFDEKEIDYIVRCLYTRPYGEVNPLINKILRAIQEQVESANKAAKPVDDNLPDQP